MRVILAKEHVTGYWKRALRGSRGAGKTDTAHSFMGSMCSKLGQLFECAAGAGRAV